ncbi:hypothetical protein PIB30_043262 [Stylosanthes scabra]|uniref:Uncharacterized protein n=1 Tax=Stylosanthes scabra TaxID=79078 RepID=A0ABU6UG09_9FABA|nr:hypothetical protein [Stylosanthes scabra]
MPVMISKSDRSERRTTPIVVNGPSVSDDEEDFMSSLKGEGVPVRQNRPGKAEARVTPTKPNSRRGAETVDVSLQKNRERRRQRERQARRASPAATYMNSEEEGTTT